MTIEPSYKVKPEFAEWACSYSGMNGGNLNGDLWFCGIEFGGTHRPEEHNNQKSNVVPFWDDDFVDRNPDCTTWQFVQKMAKISCFYEGQNCNYKQYIREKIFRSNGNTFGLNLYPLNFPNTREEYWSKELLETTGFPLKSLYKAWCIQYRSVMLRRILEEYTPKVLICTGLGSEGPFVFLNAPHCFERAEIRVLPSQKNCYIFNTTKTKFLFTPFLGQGGVMSDFDLKKIAEIAKE